MAKVATSLPGQPISYPILNEWYGTKVAREWNVPASGVGYVTLFGVRSGFLEGYEMRQVGGAGRARVLDSCRGTSRT